MRAYKRITDKILNKLLSRLIELEQKETTLENNITDINNNLIPPIKSDFDNIDISTTSYTASKNGTLHVVGITNKTSNYIILENSTNGFARINSLPSSGWKNLIDIPLNKGDTVSIKTDGTDISSIKFYY